MLDKKGTALDAAADVIVASIRTCMTRHKDGVWC
jgi:hypothetical protein